MLTELYASINCTITEKYYDYFINPVIHARKENNKPDMPVPTGDTACKVIPGVQMKKT